MIQWFVALAALSATAFVIGLFAAFMISRAVDRSSANARRSEAHE